MNVKNLKIKLKSSRSKKQIKEHKKKQPQKHQQTVVISKLEYLLNMKEMIWHDDDYDSGKDW
jgi:hypothetical protein